MKNVPDDWGCHWRKCSTCGYKWHLSECRECPRCLDRAEDEYEKDREPEYWGDIPPVEDLDLELEKAERDKAADCAAEDYFDALERGREKNRP